MKKAVDSVFQIYDKDNNGSLSRDELKPLIKAVFDQIKSKKSEHEIDKIVEGTLNATDTNKDGNITKPELFEIFKRISKH